MDAAAREFVRQRAGGRCEYCLLPEECDEWPFHLEHILAKQHGGTEEFDNLCWSCSRCNLHKGTNIASIDAESGDVVALYNPRKHQWNAHFEISDARIVGLTKVGRTTARLLHMNDVHRVDLRRDLIVRGIIQT